MKKAPEKIFICNYGSELSYEWHSESEFEAKGHNYIEYVRKDVFIEKVEEYLYKQLNEGNMECGDIETFIESFKKYIES